MLSSTQSVFPEARAGDPIVRRIAALIAAWFLVVLIGGLLGWFVSPRSQPPMALLVAVVLPPVSFALLYQSSRSFKAFALTVDLRLVTSLQSWRVIGGMFLVLYAFGQLPALFAFPAGIGDLTVGCAAPFLVSGITRVTRGWQRRLFWFNVFGLLDFLGAVGTGVLTSETSLGVFADHSLSRAVNLGAFPLSLIPTFLVPLYTILHAIALLQLGRQGSVGPNRT
jgi:hypothetical protein